MSHKFSYMVDSARYGPVSRLAVALFEEQESLLKAGLPPGLATPHLVDESSKAALADQSSSPGTGGLLRPARLSIFFASSRLARPARV